MILATAHHDNDPENNQLRNLRGLCQRCHMIHDRTTIRRSGAGSRGLVMQEIGLGSILALTSRVMDLGLMPEHHP